MKERNRTSRSPTRGAERRSRACFSATPPTGHPDATGHGMRRERGLQGWLAGAWGLAVGPWESQGPRPNSAFPPASALDLAINSPGFPGRPLEMPKDTEKQPAQSGLSQTRGDNESLALVQPQKVSETGSVILGELQRPLMWTFHTFPGKGTERLHGLASRPPKATRGRSP